MPGSFDTSDRPVTLGDLVTASDVTPLLSNARWIRANAAGSVVLRYPGSAADVTLAAVQGEYIPVCPGTLVKTATAVAVHVFGL